ncbi:MAG: hypothetical protein CL609_15505 [Anaerolineaceae bacterium]|nr:hypothetical protein [Anaerolineaceae bacterium]
MKPQAAVLQFPVNRFNNAFSNSQTTFGIELVACLLQIKRRSAVNTKCKVVANTANFKANTFSRIDQRKSLETKVFIKSLVYSICASAFKSNLELQIAKFLFYMTVMRSLIQLPEKLYRQIGSTGLGMSSKAILQASDRILYMRITST